jgi:hypothetical protein
VEVADFSLMRSEVVEKRFGRRVADVSVVPEATGDPLDRRGVVGQGVSLPLLPELDPMFETSQVTV